MSTEGQLEENLDNLAPFRSGGVIPAHPLALLRDRTLDERSQRALTRYYVDSGSAGIAVGVHTTQFSIREHGLYETVLSLAAEEARNWAPRPFTLIAGVTGPTHQACSEAETARRLGYDAILLNTAWWRGHSHDEIIAHCREVAAISPLVGFALLPRAGGMHLDHSFWMEFLQIPEVVGIKIATFDRYRTLEIVRALVDAGRETDVRLYTGNDDQIITDLLSRFVLPRDGNQVEVRFIGGLLGHWSVWTHAAVNLFERIRGADETERENLLALDAPTIDANSAIYDAPSDLAGCIPGCLEILHRQGLVQGTWCLDPDLQLSPGQGLDIERVLRTYPHLADDAFVAANLSRWLDS